MLPALRERYDLTLIDVVKTNRGGDEIPDIQIADLTDTDRGSYRRFFQGQDTVVHFAFMHPVDESADARFQSEYANVGMAYNVYQTALEEGVRRVVVASSNHAADYYEESPLKNPQGPEIGISKVIRGGNWYYKAYYMRTTYRFNERPGAFNVWQGFRCAASPNSGSGKKPLAN